MNATSAVQDPQIHMLETARCERLIVVSAHFNIAVNDFGAEIC